MNARYLWLCLVLLSGGAALGRLPYRDLSTAGAGFNGPGRQQEAPDTLSVVRVGLTGPEKSRAGQELRQGVMLAVEEANLAGGYRGRPYQVVFRPDDGPWGVAAQQVVRLAHEDQVWAIIGALDGERAHAAELVAAKLWVPVITPGAGDRTLDYANVPWVFRCLPDDRSQADLLVGAIRRQGWQRVALVAEAARDARAGAARLQEAARACSLGLALQLEYPPADPALVVPRLARERMDALVVWGRPATALPLIARLRQAGCEAPVLGPALLAVPEAAAPGQALGEVMVAAPVDLSAPLFQDFCQRYARRTHMAPSYVAAFAYDTARLVLAAIQQAGLNRARIRDELASRPFAGLTGPFSFNSLGGRQGQPVLMQVRGGQWVRR